MSANMTTLAASLLTKDYRLRPRSDSQFALEPPLAILDEAVTAIERMFVRSQQPTPAIDPANWELLIDGLVRHPLLVDYHDLQRQPVSSFFAALIGRQHGDDGYAAIANAEWIGAPLALFLAAAGIKPQAGYAVCWSDGCQPIARYLPVAKLWQDGMLAYAVNGQPLPAIHGGPVRLVVPGWAGTYWVKWIRRITLLSVEATPPEARIDGALDIDCQLFNLTEAMGTGKPLLRGAAWSAAHGVAQVALALDDEPWEEANLDIDLGPRAWRRFTFAGPTLAGHHRLAVKVTDQYGHSAIRHWQLD